LNWISYAKKDLLPAIRSQQINKLRPCIAKLNKQIEPIVFLVSNRLSLADLVIFGLLTEVVPEWSQDDTHTNDNISRWYDNIQHLPLLHPIAVEHGFYVTFKKNIPKVAPKVQAEQKGGQKGKEDQKGKKEVQSQQEQQEKPQSKKEQEPKVQQKNQDQQKPAAQQKQQKPAAQQIGAAG